ncbi:hypothetical protein M211_2386 [Acinetobacter lactucae]|nr:hypothetical protein M211_2386 [Acinetobacter lactucae]
MTSLLEPVHKNKKAWFLDHAFLFIHIFANYRDHRNAK